MVLMYQGVVCRTQRTTPRDPQFAGSAVAALENVMDVSEQDTVVLKGGHSSATHLVGLSSDPDSA